jgi:hypothetical protein
MKKDVCSKKVALTDINKTARRSNQDLWDWWGHFAQDYKAKGKSGWLCFHGADERCLGLSPEAVDNLNTILKFIQIWKIDINNFHKRDCTVSIL